MNATQVAEKLEALITRAKAGVLIGGSAGVPVQSSKGFIGEYKVTVRINVGAETWYVVEGWDAKMNPIGYTGTDRNAALAQIDV